MEMIMVICIYSDSCTHPDKCGHKNFHKCNNSCKIFCGKTQRETHCIDLKTKERKNKLNELNERRN